jgi:hypothetical protein
MYSRFLEEGSVAIEQVAQSNEASVRQGEDGDDRADSGSKGQKRQRRGESGPRREQAQHNAVVVALDNASAPSIQPTLVVRVPLGFWQNPETIASLADVMTGPGNSIPSRDEARRNLVSLPVIQAMLRQSRHQATGAVNLDVSDHSFNRPFADVQAHARTLRGLIRQLDLLTKEVTPKGAHDAQDQVRLRTSIDNLWKQISSPVMSQAQKARFTVFADHIQNVDEVVSGVKAKNAYQKNRDEMIGLAVDKEIQAHGAALELDTNFVVASRSEAERSADFKLSCEVASTAFEKERLARKERMRNTSSLDLPTKLMKIREASDQKIASLKDSHERLEAKLGQMSDQFSAFMAMMQRSMTGQPQGVTPVAPQRLAAPAPPTPPKTYLLDDDFDTDSLAGMEESHNIVTNESPPRIVSSSRVQSSSPQNLVLNAAVIYGNVINGQGVVLDHHADANDSKSASDECVDLQLQLEQAFGKKDYIAVARISALMAAKSHGH